MMHFHQHLNSIYQTLSRAVAVTHSHLRKTNGIIKKLGKRKPHHSDSSSSNSRYYCLLPILWISGCTSLKKAALIGGGSLGAGAIASIATSGTAPVLLASAVGASVMSVGADLSSKKTGGTTLNNCAESNFWDVIGQLVEMGGWLLILVVLIPMVLGWILPGPLARKKRNEDIR